MSVMDSNGDGYVTLSEFSAWWEKKGGWEYAEDPGMWGYLSGEEEEEAEKLTRQHKQLPRVEVCSSPHQNSLMHKRSLHISLLPPLVRLSTH